MGLLVGCWVGSAHILVFLLLLFALRPMTLRMMEEGCSLLHLPTHPRTLLPLLCCLLPPVSPRAPVPPFITVPSFSLESPGATRPALSPRTTTLASCLHPHARY